MDISLQKHSKFVCLAMSLILALGIFLSAGTSVYAAEQDTKDIEYYSQEEYDKAIDNLAVILENEFQAEKAADPNITEEQALKNVLAYVLSDNDDSSARSKRSLDSFGQCMAQKLGILEIKDIAKQVFNKQVVGFLKSGAWKKASAKIAQIITQRLGKKVASIVIKKIARFFLPGIGWGSMAWAGIQCGWNEI